MFVIFWMSCRISTTGKFNESSARFFNGFFGQDNGYKVAVLIWFSVLGLWYLPKTFWQRSQKSQNGAVRKVAERNVKKEKKRSKSIKKFSSSPFWPRIVLLMCFDFKRCDKIVVPWNMKRAWTCMIFLVCQVLQYLPNIMT